ncbi:hypothetical protein HanOQP8_Chr10g0353991 [Helianthus annuus]|nr:hypothetical protein HanOQP8_Chr10g0353991 [Helianthus annuus]
MYPLCSTVYRSEPHICSLSFSLQFFMFYVFVFVFQLWLKKSFITHCLQA